MQVTTTLTGVTTALNNLQDLGVRVAKRVITKAVRAGADPFVKELRRKAPRATGIMRRSLTKKIKMYGRTGTVVAIVGQNKRFLRNGKSRRVKAGLGGISGRGDLVPIHLVNNPTKAHSMIRWSRAKRQDLRVKRNNSISGRLFTRNGGFIRDNQSRVQISGKWRTLRRDRIHPGTRGTGFVEKAARASQDESLRVTQAKLEAEIMAEAANMKT